MSQYDMEEPFFEIIDPNGYRYKSIESILRKENGNNSFRHPYKLAKKIYDLIPSEHFKEKIMIIRVILMYDHNVSCDSRIIFYPPEMISELIFQLYDMLGNELSCMEERIKKNTGRIPKWLLKIKKYFNGK